MAHDHSQKKNRQYVAENQASGILASSEVHGLEMSGFVSAATDSAREMAIGILLLNLLLKSSHCESQHIVWLAMAFICGWALWRAGRTSWLAWSRLERLHRILAEERYEIEHNRPQERAELTLLYGAKGFSGKLLEDVVDVLMADEERLLRVMVQEELGFSLENIQHPLKQGLGAALGCLASALALILVYISFGLPGLYVGAVIAIGTSAAISAYCERNRIIPAVVWNLAIAALVYGVTFFLLRFFLKASF